MNNINQLITVKLLTSINNLNSNVDLNNSSNNDLFSKILSNSLNNSSLFSSKCNCRSSNYNSLETIISSVNINKLNNSSIKNNLADIDFSTSDNNITSKMDAAIGLLEQQLGKEYVWGATGPDSFDCSGLVQYIYKTSLGKNIPRTSYEQSKYGESVNREDLQVGDLVFFDTMNKGRVSHVGMYIGNNEFIHASNAKDGVKKSTLTGYYDNKYMGARRP
ncbi:MAG: C40 family peptidase [Peptostreptococcaceae bacterium]